MKKLLLLILLMAFSLVSNASLWVETFGPDDAVKNSSGYWPYVGVNSVNYLYSNFLGFYQRYPKIVN